jgi:galactokinase
MGVVDQFIKAQYDFNGFNCVFGGDIPLGAGMSSSAALEAGLAFALNSVFELRIDKLSLVKFAQKAENEYVGVQCGIMDQYINIFGKQDNVLRIDCRSLECKYYPFAFHSVSLVLFDSRVSHSLASSEYNRRREECGEGVAMIKKSFSEVNSLRDVSAEMIQKFKDKMGATIYRRCKYVVEENDRVLQACIELEKGDLKAFGKLMAKTHEGLSRDYEVSCKELDYLVELVRDDPQVYGSRMMGGGFGGCKEYLNIQEPCRSLNYLIFLIEEKISLPAVGFWFLLIERCVLGRVNSQQCSARRDGRTNRSVICVLEISVRTEM